MYLTLSSSPEMQQQVIEAHGLQICQSQHGLYALSLTYCVRDLESVRIALSKIPL